MKQEYEFKGAYYTCLRLPCVETETEYLVWTDGEIRRVCKKCNTVIYVGSDLIGRIYDWCNCRNSLEEINGKYYDVESFHPTVFEDGLYTVRFHKHGEKYLDEFTKSVVVKARSAFEAIGVAKKEIFKDV